MLKILVILTMRGVKDNFGAASIFSHLSDDSLLHISVYLLPLFLGKTNLKHIEQLCRYTSQNRHFFHSIPTPV